MPSPFPGMDPYLEDPILWSDFHHELISTCRAQLNPHLRPNYVARIEHRVYLETTTDEARKFFVPDVTVRAAGRRKPARGGAAVAVAVAESVEIAWVGDLELRESRIEIVTADESDIVAVIELLSPSNKLRDSAAAASFRAKRIEVFGSPAHWIEIDLLRAGNLPDYRRGLAPHEYAAAVFPADRRPRGRAWPIRLPTTLPTIVIPLRAPDPPVPLDLQAAAAAAYDRGAYDVTVDYAAAPPRPPLPPDLAKWAADVLTAAGLRKPRGRK